MINYRTVPYPPHIGVSQDQRQSPLTRTHLCTPNGTPTIADSELPETDAETTVRWFTPDDLHTAPDISEDTRLQAQAILATIDQSDQVLLWPGQVFG